MSLSHGILPGMPVLCSRGEKFATVESMAGSNHIKLSEDEKGQNHYIPIDWVASTDDAEVRIDRPHEEAMKEWSTTLQ